MPERGIACSQVLLTASRDELTYRPEEGRGGEGGGGGGTETESDELVARCVVAYPPISRFCAC